MKKFKNAFVLFIVLIALLFYGATSQATENECNDKKSDVLAAFEGKGEMKVYTFDSTNGSYEVFVMNNQFIFVFQNINKHSDIVYATFWEGIEFEGLTENYILCKEDKTIVAVPFSSYKNITSNSSEELNFYKMLEPISFEELPKEEQNTAFYPVEYQIKQL